MSQNIIELGVGLQYYVSDPGRLAHIHHNEQTAHGDGGNGKEFSENSDLS